MYYLGLTHLITKKCAIMQPNYCQYMYAYFMSEVGDAICIIVAGPSIPYPSTY